MLLVDMGRDHSTNSEFAKIVSSRGQQTQLMNKRPFSHEDFVAVMLEYPQPIRLR